MLKNHADLPALQLKIPPLQLSQLHAAYPYFPFRRPLQQIDTTDKRTFAGAGMADDPEYFSLVHGKVQPGQSDSRFFLVAISFGELFEFNQASVLPYLHNIAKAYFSSYMFIPIKSINK
ncbi:hypothetical protein D3C77_535780 [compost metagenome]